MRVPRLSSVWPSRGRRAGHHLGWGPRGSSLPPILSRRSLYPPPRGLEQRAVLEEVRRLGIDPGVAPGHVLDPPPEFPEAAPT